MKTQMETQTPSKSTPFTYSIRSVVYSTLNTAYKSVSFVLALSLIGLSLQGLVSLTQDSSLVQQQMLPLAEAAVDCSVPNTEFVDNDICVGVGNDEILVEGANDTVLIALTDSSSELCFAGNNGVLSGNPQFSMEYDNPPQFNPVFPTDTGDELIIQHLGTGNNIFTGLVSDQSNFTVTLTPTGDISDFNDGDTVSLIIPSGGGSNVQQFLGLTGYIGLEKCRSNATLSLNNGADTNANSITTPGTVEVFTIDRTDNDSDDIALYTIELQPINMTALPDAIRLEDNLGNVLDSDNSPQSGDSISFQLDTSSPQNQIRVLMDFNSQQTGTLRTISSTNGDLVNIPSGTVNGMRNPIVSNINAFSVNVPALPPTLNLNTAPQTVSYGGTATLTAQVVNGPFDASFTYNGIGNIEINNAAIVNGLNPVNDADTITIENITQSGVFTVFDNQSNVVATVTITVEENQVVVTETDQRGSSGINTLNGNFELVSTCDLVISGTSNINSIEIFNASNGSSLASNASNTLNQAALGVGDYRFEAITEDLSANQSANVTVSLENCVNGQPDNSVFIQVNVPGGGGIGRGRFNTQTDFKQNSIQYLSLENSIKDDGKPVEIAQLTIDEAQLNGNSSCEIKTKGNIKDGYIEVGDKTKLNLEEAIVSHQPSSSTESITMVVNPTDEYTDTSASVVDYSDLAAEVTLTIECGATDSEDLFAVAEETISIDLSTATTTGLDTKGNSIVIVGGSTEGSGDPTDTTAIKETPDNDTGGLISLGLGEEIHGAAPEDTPDEGKSCPLACTIYNLDPESSECKTLTKQLKNGFFEIKTGLEVKPEKGNEITVDGYKPSAPDNLDETTIDSFVDPDLFEGSDEITDGSDQGEEYEKETLEAGENSDDEDDIHTDLEISDLYEKDGIQVEVIDNAFLEENIDKISDSLFEEFNSSTDYNKSDQLVSEVSQESLNKLSMDSFGELNENLVNL